MSITPSVAVDTVKKPSMPISEGNTLYVGGSGPNNYTRIQNAINDANPSDTVFVYDDSSPYYEELYVDKSLNLIGEDKNTTVIDKHLCGKLILITADWVNISGFTLTATKCTDVIQLVGSDHSTINDNIILNLKRGISIYNSDKINIKGNNIMNNEKGIYLHYNSNYNTIIDNTISSNKEYGIYLRGEHNIIKGNNIKNNGYGIILLDTKESITRESITSYNLILRNNFLDNKEDAFYSTETFTFHALRTNKWRQNYWNKSLVNPKLIYGELRIKIPKYWAPSSGYMVFIIPWFPIIDWFPTKEPYDIKGVI